MGTVELTWLHVISVAQLLDLGFDSGQQRCQVRDSR